MSTQHTMYSCKDRRVDACSTKGTVNIRALEMDFFMLFLQEHPALLLGKQTVKSNGTIAKLKVRIRELDKAIDDATALVGKLPIKALEAKLTGLVRERETVGQELETANLKTMSAASAPAAFDTIKATLTAFASIPEDYAGTPQESAIVKVIEQLRQQLSDNEIRKKLLNLLPSLVDHLEIDTEKKRYRVVNHAGEASAWRKLVK